jgi:uncharacterized membrane protein YkvA (DUF1232 family)
MSRDSVVEIELNPRERRLYDRVRALVASPSPGTSMGLRDLLLLLPDLLVLLSRLIRDDRVPTLSKAIALGGIAYVLAPIDLVPVLLFGPLGLVDDLLIVAAAFSRLVNRVHPDVVRAHWPGKGDALDAIQRLTTWGESQVSGRLRDVRNWLPLRRRT